MWRVTGLQAGAGPLDEILVTNTELHTDLRTAVRELCARFPDSYWRELDAQEAYRIGIVQEIVEPGEQLDRAIELAEEIAKLAPLAVYASKASSMTFIEHGEATTIAQLADTQRRLSATEDALEGVASFKEKREAVFKGR